eukprot:m.204031 g.204031  ORF g.204031 m.204031 type:complete len:296 (+) comp18459_c0_seq3:2544-3431(+)
MSLQDRTSEFLSAAQGVRTRKGMMASRPRDSQPSSSGQASPFTQLTKYLGADLRDTNDKLEKLGKLAAKCGLFDDNPVEIQELTYIVKQDVDSLNRGVKRLEEMCQEHGFRGHRKAHSMNVVRSMQARLVSLSDRFKQVLQTRTKNLKTVRERRGQWESGASAGDSVGVNVAPTLFGQEESGGGMQGFGSLSQQAVAMEEPSNQYMEERAEGMQQIEKTIAELGQTFQQLASMIHEQGEQVIRIDANIEETDMNVEAAHTELVKYMQSVSSNRWLMLKVFGILIFFFLVFVVFLA